MRVSAWIYITAGDTASVGASDPEGRGVTAWLESESNPLAFHVECPDGAEALAGALMEAASNQRTRMAEKAPKPCAQPTPPSDGEHVRPYGAEVSHG